MIRKLFYLFSLVASALIIVASLWSSLFLFAFIVVAPLIFIGFYDVIQRKHAILRNYPLIGHFRYFLESVSPELQQYFIERDTDGAPIPRNHRDVIYQRAKNVSSTHAFGTELDLYKPGYEGFKHSVYPVKAPTTPPRVTIGGKDCKQSYEASIYNISAMSFGSLSKNAVMAMSNGAKAGEFYHNTGEGGLSEYHLSSGGAVVWQIGTGYFGCRTKEGCFDAEVFAEKVKHPNVKMIELKISQGAKPGHGGLLPAQKNTVEIAAARGITPHQVVHSPAWHQEFSDAESLLKFIKRLRDLSGGKPVGFKLCIGRTEEFVAICEAMVKTGIQPDFITVDGAEGGTGAAPLEFADSVGMPLEPALIFVDQCLRGLGLRDEIKVIASGKMVTAASILKILALGADLCNGARAFMMAVGCIQAQRCNTNDCPTGVATQRADLMRGLVVEEKSVRVANFHRNTLKSVMELMAACGISKLEEINSEILIHGYDWDGSRGPTV